MRLLENISTFISNKLARLNQNSYMKSINGELTLCDLQVNSLKTQKFSVVDKAGL